MSWSAFLANTHHLFPLAIIPWKRIYVNQVNHYNKGRFSLSMGQYSDFGSPKRYLPRDSSPPMPSVPVYVDCTTSYTLTVWLIGV